MKSIKLLRLIRREPIFLLRFVVVLLGAGILFTQVKAVQQQAREYAKLTKEKGLIARIPEMKNKIHTHTLMTMPPEQLKIQINEVEFTLEGTSIEDGIPFALIDGTIYKEGDIIKDYRIVEIKHGSITLENTSTKEIKKFSLPQPENLK